MIGRTIGAYRIDAKLGQGGMGAVYKGLDLMLERPVAIKALRADIAASSFSRARGRQYRWPFSKSTAQQGMNARTRDRRPSGRRQTPAILSKLLDSIAQISGNNIWGHIPQLNLSHLQIGQKLTRIEAVVVNDGWSIAPVLQRLAKFGKRAEG